MPRLGILGGTFDPIHNGHVLLAQFVREILELNEILFIPAADPPHKLEHPTRASASQRWCMVQLALQDCEALTPSRIELDRPGKSFTVDTLRELGRLRPGDESYLLIGADNLDQFHTWHAPDEIMKLCTVVAGSRSCEGLPEDLPGLDRIRRVDTPLFEISSTEIRQRVTEGKPIKYLVPERVEGYIFQEGLYGQCKIS
jgi:nicotinate-nucleotide adenylyltransferase